MASSIPKTRRATASFQGASPVMKVPLDSRVIISRRRTGTVRYVGRLASDTGEWYGIALDEAKGDNDGSWDKERYFQCPPNHGVFVRRKEVGTGPSYSSIGSRFQLLTHSLWVVFVLMLDLPGEGGGQMPAVPRRARLGRRQQHERQQHDRAAGVLRV